MLKFFPSFQSSGRPSLGFALPVGLVLLTSACGLWNPEAQSPKADQGTTPAPISVAPSGTPSTDVTSPPATSPTVAPSAAPDPVSKADPNRPGSPAPTAAATPSTELDSPQISNPKLEDQVVAIDDDQILKLVKKTEAKESIARQNSGQTTLYLILTNLQTERLFQPQFAASLTELPAKIPGETDAYRLSIASANVDAAYATALPKNEGLPSYIGAAYAGEAGTPPIIGICKSNVPSLKPPDQPRLLKGQIICANGSTVVALK